jgi:trehalose 6-phosphate phosphatase
MTVSSLAASTAADSLLAAHGRAIALFLDVDGTLLEIADRPERVSMPPHLIGTLSNAERRLDGALALISGRTLDELDRLFAPLRLRASAVHGAETRLDPQSEAIRSPGASELPASLWAALTDALRAFPGTFAENKRYSFTVHFRLVQDAEAALRAAVMRVIESHPAANVEVLNAHCAIELKTPGFDKGKAIASFLAASPFLDRTPVFIGDDWTDEAGFAVVASRGGFSYSVGPRRPGTVGAFAQPQDVRAWLADLADRGTGE